MSAAELWIRSHLRDAPPALVEAMLRALPTDAPSVPDALAEGALALLDSLPDAGREAALPLLAADALLTAACEAQGQIDPDGIAALAGRWGPAGRLGAVL